MTVQPVGTPDHSDSLSGSSPGTPASLIRRWGALLYEALLMFALLLVTGFALLPLIGAPAATPHTVDRLYVLPSSSQTFLFLCYVAILGIYCVAFWTGGRRTLAMKTWGLSLRTSSGQPLVVRDAVKRYLFGWIGPGAALAAYLVIGRWGLVAGLLNYAWAWFDPQSLFLHDRLAGTRVVRG